MTVEKLSTFENGGYRMGSGRTGVLLLHGLCGGPTEMRYIANGLARAGHTVHVPMFPGLGGSEDDLKKATWQDWVKAAEQALDEIAAECDTVMLAGHSTGAVIALLLAARYPDKVQSLALYSPVLWLNGFRIPWYARLFRIVTFRAFASLFDFPAPHKFGVKCPRIRDFLNAAMAAGNGPKLPVVTPGEAVLERRWLADAARKIVGHIMQPTVILHPRADDYAALNNATWLQKKLGGLVELVVLDDSYHIVTVDRQRQVVLDHTLALAGRSLAPVADVVPLHAAA